MSISRTLYRLARDSRNIKAASRGPVPLMKRIVRIHVLRYVNKNTMRLLRSFGL